MRRGLLFVLCVMLPGLSSLGARAQTLKHIIVITKENRSFDHYFGQFPGVTGGPITSYNCFGTQGGCQNGSLAVIPANPNVGDVDCGHYFANSTSDYDNGAMDKFNQNCYGNTDWAKQYGPTTIPHYWAWAQTYGLADHMFASAMGPSYPNHLYMIAATSNEAQDNPQMISGRPPNGLGGNQWTCDAFHYGRCTGNGSTLCSTNTDCTGNGTCKIDSATGTCSVGGASCTFDTDCASGYCTNDNTYQGYFYGIDIVGGTGKEMFPGVCSVHRTVGCNAICTGPAEGCNLETDCNVSSPTGNCNIADPNCTALSNDVCDASSKQFIAAGRGSACPNVTTIADRLDAEKITWGQYYSTGNASATTQIWNPVGYVQHLRYGPDWTKNVFPDTQLVTDVANCTSDANCTLPSVVWINGSGAISEHPSNLVSAGEAWTLTQVQAVMNNPYVWSNSTIFITWDDFGGFADHLAPQHDQIGWTNGIRVPLLCIGRYCLNQITTTVFTPASMLKCIENTFGVNALIGSVDGAANDACFSAGGMMSLSQNNPFPGGITTTTIASSLNPSVFGQSVTFTATVTANNGGAPSGSVTFKQGSTTLGTIPLNGSTATLSTAALNAGVQTVTAMYSGDSYFNSSSGTVNQAVSDATTTVALSSSVNPSGYNQSVTFLATITPQYGGLATGTVTFKNGTTSLGTIAVSGNAASFTTNGLAVGAQSITASYSGDGNCYPSSGALSQTVNQAGTTVALSSSVNPSMIGQTVTFTAAITPQYGGQASGTMTFKDGATTLGVSGVSGNAASLASSSLAIGTHSITAVYSGNVDFVGSTSNVVSQVVTKATSTTLLTSSMNPSVLGKTVTFTATVSSSEGTATGTVEFLDGSNVLATEPLSSGSASYKTSKLPLGSNVMTAVYGGDANNNGSTSLPVNQIVQEVTTTTIASSVNPSAYGQTVVFTANVTSNIGPPPNGELVTFKQGSTVLGTGTLNSGTATFSDATLAVGTKAVAAVYGGDTNFAGSTSKAVNQVIDKAATTTGLTSSVNPSNFGQSVTFTATVTAQYSGTPTGKIVFKDGTTTLGTVSLSAGVAAYTTSKLAVGSHTISANYQGSADFATSSGTLTQTVQ